jgi:hypothetical protein
VVTSVSEAQGAKGNSEKVDMDMCHNVRHVTVLLARSSVCREFDADEIYER